MDLKSLVHPNQSIRIIPSLEEYLNQNGFCTDLDSQIDLKFKSLMSAWLTWRRSVPVKEAVTDLFTSVPDAFSAALKFIVKCDEIKDCKPKTLPYYIIEELHLWKKSETKNVSSDIKLVAFYIAIKQPNQDFLNLIVNTYDVKSEKVTVIPWIEDLIKSGVYKNAMQCVISLELYDHIPVENLLFPLVLQDKGTLVETYLCKCPQYAKQFILYIDKLLDRSCNMKDILQRYIDEHDIIDIKWEKLYHKPLGKLVARLCAKFNVPIESCTNLRKNRTTGGLRYLIAQKYQEKNLSDSAWNDLVKDSIQQNPEALFDFVDVLIDHDAKEAKKWAQYFNLPEDKYPLALVSVTDNKLENDNQEQAQENWEETPSTSQEYYGLTLTSDKIYIIDNEHSFLNLMDIKLRHLSYVGIDCEWKPSFGAAKSRVALIQISTMENVYLIDFTVMSGIEYSNVWQIFLKSVVENAELIKVGFGLDHDLREMKNTFFNLFNLTVKEEGFLDLGKLSKVLENAGFKFPFRDEMGGGSLSSLTKACFGLPLMKHEQCSNWESRPLRESQIKYAALDAYVLVEIYSLLQELCKQQKFNFDTICCDTMLDVKQPSGKKNKKLQSKIGTQTPKEICSKSSDKVKFLVDADLSLILPYLRFCNIDSTLIEQTMLWHNVVNLAASENRYIILSKLKITPTGSYAQNYIHAVSKTSIKFQVLEILEKFQITVTPENLYRRCVLCNSVNLKSMAIKEVKQLCEKFQKCTKNDFINNVYDETDDLNRFLSDEDSDEELYQPVANDSTSRVPNTEDQEPLLTETGVTMRLAEVIQDLKLDYSDPITLCQDCGKFYWTDNYPIPDSFIDDLPLS